MNGPAMQDSDRPLAGLLAATTALSLGRERRRPGRHARAAMGGSG